MKRIRLCLLAAVIATGIAGCSDSDSSGSFSETFVPGQSLGGVLLGETYGSVVAVHGEPDRLSAANPDGIRSASYGNTVGILFSDADGDRQLSSADKVMSISGIYANGEGLFRFSGVGTGSTVAEIIAVFGNPFFSSDIMLVYLTGNGTGMIFSIRDSVVQEVTIN